MEKDEFAEWFKIRTKWLVLDSIRLFKVIKSSQESTMIRGQLIRSTASVASNYRAACRARSRAEFFSKMSVVVEEADESLFWIEVLEESGIAPIEQIGSLKQEALEILRITATARKTTNNNKPKK